MVILVIGPSGVGKSDYAAYAAQSIPGCAFSDLDIEVRNKTGMEAGDLLPLINNDAFLCVCQMIVDEILQSHRYRVAIVAVGAGALQSGKARDWLLQHPGPRIAVIADPYEVYCRRARDVDFDTFTGTEFSQRRMQLYETAERKCCVAGLSKNESRDQFTELVRKIIEGNPQKAGV